MSIFPLCLIEPYLNSWVLTAIILILITFYEYRKDFTISHLGEKRISGPFPLPILGNILTISIFNPKNQFQKYINLYKTYSNKSGIARFWLLNRMYIVLTSPEYIEKILGNVKIVNKAKEYNILSESPFGNGLISQLDENTWKIHRKIITPTFHFNILKTYIPIFYEEINILIKKIEEQNHFSNEIIKNNNEIKIMNFKPFIQLCTFDMIMRSVFGFNINAQNNKDHKFVNAMSEATKIIQNRIAMPIFFIDLLFKLFGLKKQQNEVKKKCFEFTEYIIRKKRLEYNIKKKQINNNNENNNNFKNKEIKNNKNINHSEDSNENIELLQETQQSEKKYIQDKNLNNIKNENLKNHEENEKNIVGEDIPGSKTTEKKILTNHYKEEDMLNEVNNNEIQKSFIELLIENEDNEIMKMTDEELRDNIITLMFAGHDTSTTTNCATLLLLGIHKDIQEKVIEEIDEIFGGPKQDKGCCPTYNEIMKMNLLDRVIKESSRLFPAAPIIGRNVTEDTTVGSYIIPKDSSIVLFLLGLHRDKNYHSIPNIFYPDRFLLNYQNHHKFSFLPFGAGSRNCIGQKYAMLQIKVVLSTILRYYSVATDENIQSIEDVDKLIQIDVTLNLIKCPIILKKRM